MAVKFQGGRSVPATTQGPDFQLAQTLANDIRRAIQSAQRLDAAEKRANGSNSSGNADVYRVINFLKEAEESLGDYLMG